MPLPPRAPDLEPEQAQRVRHYMQIAVESALTESDDDPWKTLQHFQMLAGIAAHESAICREVWSAVADILSARFAHEKGAEIDRKELNETLQMGLNIARDIYDPEDEDDGEPKPQT